VADPVSRPSILDLIGDREAAARRGADRLREQIAALSEQLRLAETELADLSTTRSTLLTLTGGPQPDADAGETIARPAYQQILAVFGPTRAMRAKDVCLALGTDTAPKDTEGARVKLKRLVARGVLTEQKPGLFALAPPVAHPTDATVA
jgi:hypothetical protein